MYIFAIEIRLILLKMHIQSTKMTFTDAEKSLVTINALSLSSFTVNYLLLLRRRWFKEKCCTLIVTSRFAPNWKTSTNEKCII